jgi:putative Ca2+/H+ antiporter (TMEM165/GDT1 family)
MPEELRVLLSTFALLFVAELGDTTQLAVISMTAKHKMPSGSLSTPPWPWLPSHC